MSYIQTKTWRKGVLFFNLLFSCFLMLHPLLTAFAAGDSVSVSFQVSQTFTQTGNSANIDGKFSYTLTSLENGNPMPSGSSSGVYNFIIDGTATVTVGPITYTSTGIYNYQIKINAPTNKPGYTYDRQVYTVSVYVKNYNGNLVAETIVKKGTSAKVNNIHFTNKYSPIATDPFLMVDPPVKKTVSGNPSKNATFTFTLTAAKPSYPMPKGSVNGVKTTTIVGSGEEEFGTWQYTEAGTYFYTVAEVNTGESGYTYDTSIYTITDVVSDIDGQLVLERVVTNSSNKPVSAYVFINKFTDKGISIVIDNVIEKGTDIDIVIENVIDNGNVIDNSNNNNNDTDNSNDNDVDNSNDDDIDNSNDNDVDNSNDDDIDNNNDNNTDQDPGPGQNTNPNPNPGPTVTGVTGPKTGDDALQTPYFVAIVVSSFIAMGCIYCLRKREN